MKVCDLFSGLGGWSRAFRNRGHGVVTIDLDYSFNPTYVRDIRNIDNLDQFGRFDVILASPPCNAFSLLAHGKYWAAGGIPKADAQRAIDLVLHTFALIEKGAPSFWIVENPVGMLRHVVAPVATITQCKYGRPERKATDLWGKLPPSFVPLKCKKGDQCHTYVPMGAMNLGTREIKKNSSGKWYTFKQMRAIRAEIPYGLSLAMCLACEKDLPAS